jgi:hypothetical protein
MIKISIVININEMFCCRDSSVRHTGIWLGCSPNAPHLSLLFSFFSVYEQTEIRSYCTKRGENSIPGW